MLGFCAVFALLTSCATLGLPDVGFTNASYQTLGTMASTYNMAWLSFKQAYNDKVVNEADFQKGKGYANTFYTNYQKAVDVLAKYKKGEGTKIEVERSLELAQGVANILREFILSKGVKIPETVKP
jgi:hypothetical protein